MRLNMPKPSCQRIVAAKNLAVSGNNGFNSAELQDSVAARAHKQDVGSEGVCYLNLHGCWWIPQFG
jgi:hypothetical protein